MTDETKKPAVKAAEKKPTAAAMPKQSAASKTNVAVKKVAAKKPAATKKAAAVKKTTASQAKKVATAKPSKTVTASAKPKRAAVKKNASRSKLQIRLVGYDHRLIDRSTAEIVETAKHTGARILGPIPLPTKKERLTVLISPHKDKDARDQYEIRTHKRLIVLIEPTEKTVDALMKLDLAAGIDVKINVVSIK